MILQDFIFDLLAILVYISDTKKKKTLISQKENLERRIMCAFDVNRWLLIISFTTV